MCKREQRRADLLREIERAFGDVELGDGVTLHEAAALDGYASKQECVQARALDDGRHWKEVTDQELVECGETLFFMDELGVRFYLAAYMSWTIRHYEETELNLASHATQVIADRKAELFSLEQCSAIRAFLNYLRLEFEDQDAEAALAGYWRNFREDAAGSCLPDPDSVSRRQANPLQEAMRLFRFGRFTEAIDYLESATQQIEVRRHEASRLRELPDESRQLRSQLFQVLGNCHKSQGNMAAARQAFEKAIRDNSANAEAHLALGWIKLQHDEIEWASHFSKAMEHAPEIAGIALRALPELLRKKADKLSLSGDYMVAAHLALAVAHAESGSPAECRREIEMAVCRSGHRQELAATLFAELLG